MFDRIPLFLAKSMRTESLNFDKAFMNYDASIFHFIFGIINVVVTHKETAARVYDNHILGSFSIFNMTIISTIQLFLFSTLHHLK